MIKTYGTDRPESKTGNNTGVLPDGNKNISFEYMFCCREDQHPGSPLDNFALRDPIILFNVWWDCQEIKGIIYQCYQY